MAGGDNLTKLKSAIKRWPSFIKPTPPTTDYSMSSSTDAASSGAGAGADPNLHAVYVGKSRRRYLVRSDVIEHPLFRELVVEKSEEAESVVACEVVLFEHLLWMMDNSEIGSMEDLVEFYTC